MHLCVRHVCVCMCLLTQTNTHRNASSVLCFAQGTGFVCLLYLLCRDTQELVWTAQGGTVAPPTG